MTCDIGREHKASMEALDLFSEASTTLILLFECAQPPFPIQLSAG